MKTAVVLSGGGAKGAYQIGVWKALRKLGINYDIVTGTSVGALNGILMVQNDYHEAIKLWTNIDYNLVFNKNLDDNDEKIYLTYVKSFIKDGGMDISNLEKAVDKNFDSKRFFESPIDFGIVTYNLSKMKEELLIKNNLTSNNVKDYVIASATCYPAFKIKKINNQKYIDGGFHDIMPINLAIDLGADRVIAVDLKSIGVRKKVKNKNIEIIDIKPNNKIGSILKFDKEVSARNIKYGYNDAMKVFHKLIGKKYTFYKGTYNFFVKKIEKKFINKLNSYLDNHHNLLEQLKMLLPKVILKKTTTIDNVDIIKTVEFVGEVMKMDDSKIYFLNHYNYVIKKKFKEIPDVDEISIKEKITKKEFSKLINSETVVKYIYQVLKDKDKYSEIYSLVPIFKKEFLAAIYLLSIGC